MVALLLVLLLLLLLLLGMQHNAIKVEGGLKCDTRPYSGTHK